MKNFKRAMSCAMAVAMALSCAAVPAFAAEDMTEPNPVIEAHPDDGMSPTKVVTPIGQKTFYKISGDRVIYTDRDDGTGWEAVPSQYIKGSEYNVGNVDYGIYATSDGEVHFVALSDCHDEGNGTYTWYHGTSDSATVSEDVDKATNTDPTMGTQFYLNIENGIDPDGTTEEDKVEAGTADERVDYEITVGTKTTYQLNATVPMYVCKPGAQETRSMLQILKEKCFLYQDDMIPKTGLGTKDFIAPTSFDFRQSRLFRMGSTCLTRVYSWKNPSVRIFEPFCGRILRRKITHRKFVSSKEFRILNAAKSMQHRH